VQTNNKTTEMNDREYYERRAAHDNQRQESLNKAKARGEAAKEWFKTNKLTRETKPEFDALMKRIDNDLKRTK